MSKLTILVFLHISILFVNSDFCGPNYALGDFPEGIMLDMFQAMTTGDIPGFQGCPDNIEIDNNKVGLWFNNNDKPDQLVRLEHSNPKSINFNKPLFLLIHGWLCNVTTNLMPELKDAYLKRYNDINVIRVEWNTYATDRFFNSYCYIPKIAKRLGEFLCGLNSTSHLNLDDTHIVGHSMGGQISGLTGKEIQKQCNRKVGRITGLDPGCPVYYQKATESQRLHKSDAKIVDVIHTNAGQAGFPEPCGTVDFYPNCGTFQPNSIRLSKSTKLEDLRSHPLDTLLRGHLLAVEYMIESVLNGPFRATKCSNCTTSCCLDETESATIGFMGEDLSEDIQGEYVVITNGNKPYNREFRPVQTNSSTNTKEDTSFKHRLHNLFGRKIFK